MAIPTSGYPTTLDDTNATPSATVEFPQPASSTDLDATNVEHDLLHKNLSLAIVALETKLGITDSNATAGTLLKGTGSGSSEWSSTLPAVTLGGAVTGGDQIMSTVTHKDYAETVYAGGNTGTSQTLAETNGNVQTWTMNGNCTFTMPSGSGLQAGTSLTLILTQDGTGSRTGAFTGVKWAGGAAPTLTTTATTGIDVLTFITFNGGASPVWYGFVAGAAMA